MKRFGMTLLANAHIIALGFVVVAPIVWLAVLEPKIALAVAIIAVSVFLLFSLFWFAIWLADKSEEAQRWLQQHPKERR